MQNMTKIATTETIDLENARFMSRVYRWMTGGILLTALVSSYIASQPSLLKQILQPSVFWVVIGLQVGAVFFLSLAIKKMNALTAILTYLVYAGLTGVTLSIIFLIYTKQSISNVFLTTACGFGGLSAFGYFSKKDLGPIGSFCTMGLFGLVGFSLLSFFFPSFRGEQAQQVFSIIGLIVFSGLTAYDTQKIKQLNIIGNEGTEEDTKEAIFGALTLYLDFINLFLNLLRLQGRRRD
jgi:hypothetical protein